MRCFASAVIPFLKIHAIDVCRGEHRSPKFSRRSLAGLSRNGITRLTFGSSAKRRPGIFEPSLSLLSVTATQSPTGKSFEPLFDSTSIKLMNILSRIQICHVLFIAVIQQGRAYFPGKRRSRAYHPLLSLRPSRMRFVWIDVRFKSVLVRN